MTDGEIGWLLFGVGLGALAGWWMTTLMFLRDLEREEPRGPAPDPDLPLTVRRGVYDQELEDVRRPW